jgi:glutathione S-transferase
VLAIINFLLETHENKLISHIGDPDRSICFQWLSFLSTALGNANNRFFFPNRYGSTDEIIKAQAELDRKSCYDILENNTNTFLSGKNLGIADFYFYMFMQWDENKASELSKRPKINAIYNHMDKKASIQKVMNNQNA